MNYSELKVKSAEWILQIIWPEVAPEHGPCGPGGQMATSGVCGWPSGPKSLENAACARRVWQRVIVWPPDPA